MKTLSAFHKRLLAKKHLSFWGFFGQCSFSAYGAGFSSRQAFLTSFGVQYPSAECRRAWLLRSSILRVMSTRACSRVGYTVRLTRSTLRALFTEWRLNWFREIGRRAFGALADVSGMIWVENTHIIRGGRPMRYQSTLGLSAEQLEELHVRLCEVVESGTWPPLMPKMLSVWQQMVIVLMIVRQNVSQTFPADLHAVSQPTISRCCRAVMPLLDKVLGLHEPALRDVLRNRTTLIDGTDIPTRNRKNAGKDNYSGKRHRQGLNVQVASSTDGVLLGVSDPVPGRRHDRRAVTECGWEDLLDQHDWIADPGYQGTTATTPKRKPIGLFRIGGV